MNTLNQLIFFSGILLSTNVFSNSVCQDLHGTLRCGEGTVESIKYKGFVDLDGSTVLGEFDVYGNANIHNGQLNNVFIRGVSHLLNSNILNALQIVGNVNAQNIDINKSAKVIGNFLGRKIKFNSLTNIIGTVFCDNCFFKQDTILIGELRINSSEFLGPVTINAKTSEFYNTKLSDIKITKPTKNEQQVIYLKDHCIAHNIHFASQKGIIYLSVDSLILGNVQGGKIQRI